MGEKVESFLFSIYRKFTLQCKFLNLNVDDAFEENGMAGSFHESKSSAGTPLEARQCDRISVIAISFI